MHKQLSAIGGKLAAFKLGEFDASDAVFVLGLLTAAWIALRILGAILGFVTAPAKRKISSYGQWAVVTGATDGIGKAYATELAKRGLDVVIIGRSAEKLKATETEIAGKTQRKVVSIVADFSKPQGLYERIEAELKAATATGGVGVLVNNVGVSYPGALFFHELEQYAPGRTAELINLNVLATTKMTQIVLPGMLERKRGAIINISSAAGRIPIGNPLYAVYSGTKAYVDYFSRSLHREYARSGVHVQCQSPYFVATAMSKIRKASLGVPSPAGFAKAAVDAIGSGDSVVPFWSHDLQDSMLQAMPHWALEKYIVPLHLGLRKAFFRKLEREAAAGAEARKAQ